MKNKILLITFLVLPATLFTQSATQILIKGARVFDGKSTELTKPVNVLVEGNIIKQISSNNIQTNQDALIINGNGKTLMPGLIDAHVHLVFSSVTSEEIFNPEVTQEYLIDKACKGAEQMLLRGFTSIRELGGPSFPVKALIDAGKVKGPRIWPAGAVISQTGGHGDFRAPNEKSRRFFGKASRTEVMGANFIADGVDEVLTATRENLRFGAAFIKIMAGGGIASDYDPIDVTQYTLEEMKAAVNAAEDWGTYVTVHAYTPRAVRRAIEAGVKCIEHGQMLDEETLNLIKEKDIWLSLQTLHFSPHDLEPSRIDKTKPVMEGEPKVWSKAKELGIKLAWGTDFLFEPEENSLQNEIILKLTEWFTPAEILKLITHDNAQLLKLSGLRSPYKGELGVVQEGALADLILVDGDPLKNLSLMTNPDKNFLVIIKDGKVYKNIIKK